MKNQPCGGERSPKFHKGAEPSEHVIPVQFDPVDYSLKVTRPRYTLLGGDLVIWQSLDLPDGWSPFVLASDEVGERAFETLTQSSKAVWGRLREDVEVCYLEYRATAQRGLGKPPERDFGLLQSPQASLRVKARGQAQRHIFKVRVAEGDDGPTLRVKPEGHCIESGDSVEWRFRKKDLRRLRRESGQDLRPRIDFTSFKGRAQPVNEQLGPFTTLAFGKNRVVGRGHSGAQGRFYFNAALVGGDDNVALWMSSGDPFVDDAGDATDPSSG